MWILKWVFVPTEYVERMKAEKDIKGLIKTLG